MMSILAFLLANFLLHGLNLLPNQAFIQYFLLLMNGVTLTEFKRCKCLLQQGNWMTQITILNILQKIRFICKECSFKTLPQKILNPDHLDHLQPYLQTLETIRIELLKYRELQEEYAKLERLLQREETQLRRRVGLENQMRLYVQAMKQDAEETYKQNVEFKENTKIHIKQLKKVNQLLFIQLDTQISKTKQSNMETMQKSERKVVKQRLEGNKSFNKSKAKRQRSIKEIIKTEFIQREKFNTQTKRQRKMHQYKLHSSITSDAQTQNKHLQSNLKTYHQDREAHQQHNLTGRKIKNKPKQLNKGNTYLVSNQTLTNFFDQSKVSTRKNQNQLLPNHDTKEKFIKNRAENLSRHRSRQRRQNRSVYTVLSSQQNENKKSIF